MLCIAPGGGSRKEVRRPGNRSFILYKKKGSRSFSPYRAAEPSDKRRLLLREEAFRPTKSALEPPWMAMTHFGADTHPTVPPHPEGGGAFTKLPQSAVNGKGKLPQSSPMKYHEVFRTWEVNWSSIANEAMLCHPTRLSTRGVKTSKGKCDKKQHKQEMRRLEAHKPFGLQIQHHRVVRQGVDHGFRPLRPFKSMNH